jgi:four helix bundle protein
MKIVKFEDLDCWKEAKLLVQLVYSAVNKVDRFRKDYGLKDQVVRSAVSVMSNIAEGFTRKSNKEFIQFLYISKSSSAEVQSIFYVALDQQYITKDIFEKIYNQADKVSRMNSNFIKYLKNNLKK